MTIDPIGTVRSCFGEKFAVPRQPGLCPSAWGRLVFHPAYRSPEAVRGIEGFSHLWLIFGFHETVAQGWKPTVRPPRLGGNQRIGVFASRSTFRPNGLGLSLVRLEGIDRTCALCRGFAGGDGGIRRGGDFAAAGGGGACGCGKFRALAEAGAGGADRGVVARSASGDAGG